MNGDLFSSISNLVTSILHDFANASGPANLITISGPVITIGGAIWGYLRYRLKDKDSQIRQLQEDRASRDRTIDKLSISQKELEARCAQAESELPQRALDKSEAEWRENNDVHSARAITEWFKDYGQPVSQMLLRRAQWAVGHAAGDFHSMGLVAAQSYAIAAVAVNQENHGAVILFEQAEKLLDEAEQPAPPLIQALAEFDERCHEWFDPDLVKAAMVAQNEAILRLERGYYHLAMPTAEQAQIWLIQSLGEKPVQPCGCNTSKLLFLCTSGDTMRRLRKRKAWSRISRRIQPSARTIQTRWRAATLRLLFLWISGDTMRRWRKRKAWSRISRRIQPSARTIPTRWLVATLWLLFLWISGDTMRRWRKRKACSRIRKRIQPSARTIPKRWLVATLLLISLCTSGDTRRRWRKRKACSRIMRRIQPSGRSILTRCRVAGLWLIFLSASGDTRRRWRERKKWLMIVSRIQPSGRTIPKRC